MNNAEQINDLLVLEAAMTRDKGNRNNSWTPEEVQAANRVDDAYDEDDLAPRGYWGLQNDEE